MCEKIEDTMDVKFKNLTGILPRQGHLNAILRIFDYMKSHVEAKLVFDIKRFDMELGKEIRKELP